MEQSTTTRDTPRWVQQWEADRERGFRAYLFRVGIIYFGLSIFTALAATEHARGTLPDVWLSLALWSFGVGIFMAFASWWWRGAHYDEYWNEHR